MPGHETLPTIDDVLAAAERISGRAVATPLLEAPALNALVGGRLLVKAEPLQLTGSFKFRGAYNRISRIPEAERPAGVVAYSSGNHAQGVAAAAHLLGVPAVIVMPENAPRAKREGTERWGAEIATYDPGDHDSRETIAAEILRQRGGTLVRPFDDPWIIAGQGTVGLEIAERARSLDLELDAVLVPCGGGGLTAGTATAIKALSPATEVYTVEPEGFDDTARSLAAGSRQRNPDGGASFCDALLAPTPGRLTFAVNAKLVSAGLSVSDVEVGAAMAAAFAHLKLVVEPGGAVALAAALRGKYDCRDKTVAVVTSGGNVDAGTYAEALRRAE
ncbi:MAG: threonine/serine dehydratase [Alphaproteobacteria bacterium]|nr:threonine/serine dehydratase [Alphaproteobacteria bacterium]